MSSKKGGMAFVLFMILLILLMAGLGFLSMPINKLKLAADVARSIELCDRGDLMSSSYCLNDYYTNAMETNCTAASWYYALTLDRIGYDHDIVKTVNHQFTIGHDNESYCILDMDYIQCIKVGGKLE